MVINPDPRNPFHGKLHVLEVHILYEDDVWRLSKTFPEGTFIWLFELADQWSDHKGNMGFTGTVKGYPDAEKGDEVWFSYDTATALFRIDMIPEKEGLCEYIRSHTYTVVIEGDRVIVSGFPEVWPEMLCYRWVLRR